MKLFLFGSLGRESKFLHKTRKRSSSVRARHWDDDSYEDKEYKKDKKKKKNPFSFESDYEVND